MGADGTIGALIGPSIEGEVRHGGRAIAAPRRQPKGVHAFSDEDARDVIEDIANNSTAALVSTEPGGEPHDHRVLPPATGETRRSAANEVVAFPTGRLVDHLTPTHQPVST